jgi:F420H(2)-dependent biliverdin reductase
MTTISERLENERNIWLATVRADGSPHLVPVWFVWHEAAFWICTGATSAKARNLVCTPTAAVSLEDGNAPVAAWCDAVLHRPPFDPAIAAAFAKKFDWDISDPADPDGPFYLLVELRPTRWPFAGP